MLEGEPGAVEVPVEIIDLVPVGVEADHSKTIRNEVVCDAGEHLLLGADFDECHDVASEHCAVEKFGLPEAGQIKISEVADQPGGARVVTCGSGDEFWVDINTDDLMPAGVQIPADSAWTTPSIKDAGTAGNHGINESALADEVNPFGSQTTEAIDVPLRVALIGIGEPPWLGAHACCTVAPSHDAGLVSWSAGQLIR